MGWLVSTTPLLLYPAIVPVWAWGSVWTGTENLALIRIRSRFIQPVESRYTEHVFPAARLQMDSDSQPARQAGWHTIIYYKRVPKGQTAIKKHVPCLKYFLWAFIPAPLLGNSTNCRCLKIKRAQENIRWWKKNKWGNRQAVHTKCFKETPCGPESEIIGHSVPCDERFLRSIAEGC
jgi:hypothetical protein